MTFLIHSIKTFDKLGSYANLYLPLGVTLGNGSRSLSQASAFDENTLNVSQFVQITETFLGDGPEKDDFGSLIRYVKSGYEETEDEKMNRMLKVLSSLGS